jgi:hypothetical protein
VLRGFGLARFLLPPAALRAFQTLVSACRLGKDESNRRTGNFLWPDVDLAFCRSTTLWNVIR